MAAYLSRFQTVLFGIRLKSMSKVIHCNSPLLLPPWLLAPRGDVKPPRGEVKPPRELKFPFLSSLARFFDTSIDRVLPLKELPDSDSAFFMSDSSDKVTKQKLR